MKKLLLLLLVLGALSCAKDKNTPDDTPGHNGIFEGDVLLNDQDDVDAFASEQYTQITGGLKIRDHDFYPYDGVYDLGPLQSLTSIGGKLIIIEADHLTSLHGLENLVAIGEGIRIWRTNLDNLNPLSNVVANDIELSLVRMPMITNLNALSGIQSLSVLQILEMSSLQNINGLSNITSMSQGIIDIRINPVLSDISILEQVTFEGFSYLLLSNNPNLEDIDFMQGVSYMTDTLRIEDNATLSNLDGLSNIEFVGSQFRVRDNENLSDFCGIQNLVVNGEIVGDYTVYNNAYNPTQQDIIDGNCSL